MIPWLREKRERWLAAARKRNTASSSGCTQLTIECVEQEQALELQSTSLQDDRENSADNESSESRVASVSVRVISPRGLIQLVTVPLTATGDELKTAALRLFKTASETSDNYKLIRTRNRATLEGSITMEAAKIDKNDEFVLAFFKTNVEIETAESLRGPTIEEIMSATAHIPVNKVSPPQMNIDELMDHTDLQYDIRKILISLVNASAYVIGSGPYADRLISMLKKRLNNRRKHDFDAVQCLVDMGFDEVAVVNALKLHNHVYTAALDSLIDHQNVTTAKADTDSSVNNVTMVENIGKNVEVLLKLIRIYCKREITPNAQMVDALVEMGFSETDVCAALRATANNQVAACEWLVGNRTRNLADLQNGLPVDSPILKALLASPQVQLSFGNPKMFIAYLSLLDNNSAMGMWLSDNDTSGVLGHILRTYHEEKHIVAINQYSTLI